jgi:hypothetical protein
VAMQLQPQGQPVQQTQSMPTTARPHGSFGGAPRGPVQEPHRQPPKGCNPFLLPEGEKPKPPQRIYAVLDQAEVTEDDRHVLLFGALDADTLDARSDEIPNLSRAGNFTEIYQRLPLFLLEVILSGNAVSRLDQQTTWVPTADDQATGEGSMPDNVAGEVLQRLEGRWIEFRLDEAGGGVGANLYRNLFAAPNPIFVSSAQDPTGLAMQLLAQSDPLASQPDATTTDIETALAAVKNGLDGIGVYDVGQGNANGLLNSGKVTAYFDFGGGAGPNSTTFPTSALTNFCFCSAQPPIVLSHWDHDHWSSEGRDTRAHSATWIAPRQTVGGSTRAPHHNALISSIKAHGRLLIWPSSVPTMTIGQVRIHQCTGTSKNASGLAAEVFSTSISNTDSVLLPADAGYSDLPSAASAAFDAIVCPHHGGRSHSPQVPGRPAKLYSRLFYSYGPSNSYKHPLPATYTAHDAAAWTDQRVAGRNAPFYVLNTEQRTANGLGHIGFDWGTTTAPSSAPCGGSCQLDIQQW